MLPNHNGLPETFQHRQLTCAGWHRSPDIRQSVSSRTERARQQTQNSSYTTMCRIVSKTFMNVTKPLNSSPSGTRLEMWEIRLHETSAVIKIGFLPAESLPAGSDQPWFCWRSLNCDEAQSARCDLGEDQTVYHLLHTE